MNITGPGSSGNLISSSDISSNGLFGVHLDQDATGNKINGNTVRFNDIFQVNNTGIEVQGNGNTIRSNTVSNNNSPGIAVSGDNNLIRGNTVNNNSVDGIAIQVGATNNRIQGNTALGNGGVDLREDNPGCDANIWKSNTFVTEVDPANCVQ